MEPYNREIQPHDEDYAGDIFLYKNTFLFLYEGVKKLRAKVAELEAEFKKVMNAFDLDKSPLQDELSEIDYLLEWCEERLAQSNSYRVRLGITYGGLRLLKAGGIIKVRELESIRDNFIRSQSVIPKSMLTAIESKVRQRKDMLEQGKMNGLAPADLFLELDSSDELRDKIENGSENISLSSPPLIRVELGEIQILDQELRSRCLPILKSRVEEQDESKLDSVVREMSVILEDRVRNLAGIPESLTGADLMRRAFNGSPPILQFSPDPGIQGSAYLLFQGYIGFFRNEVMHRLVKTYIRDRVYQLLGYVDHLLFLLTQAQVTTATGQTPP